MNDTIRAALITLIKSKRQKMSRSQRRRGIRPQRWLYPWATEARYAATIRAWLRPMKDYAHKYLKENQEAVLRGDSADLPTDSADTITASRLDAVPGKSFKRMIDSLNGWLGQYVPDDDESKSGSPIYMGLGNIADSTFDFNEGQYEKGAKSVLGVEFPVGEDWWPFARDMWANKNYDNLSDLMKRYIRQVRDLTEKAVTSGFSVKELTKQIQALDNKFTKSYAEFIARDQIGKLNGEITQRRMESVGLTMYIWETSGDERVRPSHEMMDGGLCRWDDPAVYSLDGGKTWIPRPSGAVTQHPGMDYQCRCTATSYWYELVGEADAMIEQYEELDALAAQNIAAMPKTTPPELPLAPALVPQSKKFITQKMLQAQAADLENQMEAIDLEKATSADKQLYDDLKAKKEAVEAEIEKKKIAAQKSLLTKKVKKLEKEIKGIQVKTYSGIWKDDVTTADYADKVASIQAKKDYFVAKLASGDLSDSDKAKFNLFLKDLNEFEAEGKRYADIQAALKATKGQLTSLRKGSNIDNNPYTQERKDAALWAKTPKAADDALRGVCGEVWKNATQAERLAIYDYTQGSVGFNRPLRGYDGSWDDFKGAEKVPLNNEGRATAIKNMTKLIDRSKYDFDIWLQRGIKSSKGAAEFLGISEDNLRHWSQAELKKNLVDKEVNRTDHGFVSCGSSKGKGFSGYIFNIYCPKGTKMMYTEPFSYYGGGDKLRWDSISKHSDGISKQSGFGYEDETIIQRSTTFRVIKVEKKGTDIFFDVEIVEQI
jgi:SPP1 gp7 family putative phage head morphogenesis protein